MDHVDRRETLKDQVRAKVNRAHAACAEVLQKLRLVLDAETARFAAVELASLKFGEEAGADEPRQQSGGLDVGRVGSQAVGRQQPAAIEQGSQFDNGWAR